MESSTSPDAVHRFEQEFENLEEIEFLDNKLSEKSGIDFEELRDEQESRETENSLERFAADIELPA